MVGVKRPYPFSLDNPSGPSFDSKFPTFAAPIRSDESASHGNGGTLVFNQGNPIFRSALGFIYWPRILNGKSLLVYVSLC